MHRAERRNTTIEESVCTPSSSHSAVINLVSCVCARRRGAINTYRVVNLKRHTVPRIEGAEERLEVVPVPDKHVGQHSSEGQIRSDEIERVGSGEKRRLFGEKKSL